MTDAVLAPPPLHPAPSIPFERFGHQPATLIEVFESTLIRFGDRTAVQTPETSLDYRGLTRAASGIAQRLRRGGVGAGDRIGVRLPSGTTDLYVAILGVLYAGAAYVPVDADDPPARVEHAFSAADVCAVLGEDLEIIWRRRGSGRPGEPGPEDDAWIIFTSGSTGTPKGVAVTHRAAAAFVAAEAHLWQITPSDRVLAGLSVSFDASCEELWLAWANGAALVPAPRELVRTGTELGPWLTEHGVTVISTVPTLAALWNQADLAGIRLMILGGEACPEALAWRLSSHCELWNTYGPTEATVVTTAGRLLPRRPVTIGFALNGWQTAVVGPDDLPVAPGEPGELVIAGLGLARYIDPELDRERFRGLAALGWTRAYRTGDVVRETGEGLVFVGRRDHQVKVGGRRIELGEIDSALSAVPEVRAACTVVQRTPAGDARLVGYVAAKASAAAIRENLAGRLPADLVPLVIVLDALPVSTSGKIDRQALPWPPPARAGVPEPELATRSATETWLSELWIEQLGPVPIGLEDDFFALGASSLAAAKLASRLRERFPAAAVADIYHYRGLATLAARLDAVAAPQAPPVAVVAAGHRRWGLAQLAGVVLLMIISMPQWLLGILAENRLYAGSIGPRLSWLALGAAWLMLCSAPMRALFAVGARRLLLPRIPPGRHPRNGWLACRIWFVERISEVCRLESLAGTPWAARYARLSGHRVGHNARLGSLPPATSLITIGAEATIEAEADLHGWWIEGGELVIDALEIGAGARIGTRSLLMPGARIGAGSEVEPGSVIDTAVPAGERWAGAPARRVGVAGEFWPAEPAREQRGLGPRLWRAMFAVGMLAANVIAVVAIAPAVALLALVAPDHWTTGWILGSALAGPVLVAATVIVSYAVLVALAVRAISPLISEGWQTEYGACGWALWMTGYLMASARGILFPLFASVYTRPWLRLAGIEVGRRAELSTVVGLNRTTRFAPGSFCADDVVLAGTRSRAGWLHVAPITVGAEAFLGNGALISGDTEIGAGSLVGVLTTPPSPVPAGTAWLGAPALELPRRPPLADRARTVEPPGRLIAARGAVELVRILHPMAISAALAAVVFIVLDQIGSSLGIIALVLATAPVLLVAALIATAITIAIKWAVIGRYRSGDHPLWSAFVWRDEIVNTAQEQLAGAWLLNMALGTPLMRVYLRLMGARIGRDAWIETLTITEFDLAQLGNGAVANRNSVVETHLFHDRVMQIGPASLQAGATLGPAAAMLPDTEIGAGCSVGGRSIVMRGERLPAGTRWHGAPVVARR